MPIPRSLRGLVAWLVAAGGAAVVVGAAFGLNPAGLSAGFVALFVGGWLVWLLERGRPKEGGSLVSDVVPEPLPGVRPGVWRTHDPGVNAGAIIAFAGLLIVAMGAGWEVKLAGFLGTGQVPVGVTMLASGLLAAIPRAIWLRRSEG